MLPPLLVGLLAGCAEQPYGYIFSPERRDQVNVARRAGDFIGSLYERTDQAADLLQETGLTTDFRSVLPEGWTEVTPRDSAGNPLGESYVFLRNYLDRDYYVLTMARNPSPGAVRNPARLQYQFAAVGSLRNYITRNYFGALDEEHRLDLSYADNLQNVHFVEGWFSIRKIVPFEQEIEILVNGKNQKVTYDIYLNVSWMMRVERFSIDPYDQRSRIVVEGEFPILDAENNIQKAHVSGELNINSDGAGGGDIWLYGQPTARISFSGRSFGFKGSFTLFSEDHKKSYNL